ncbi:MAG: phage tail tape measure protein [Pseudomonadota bacterium]|nr:phage tail tape measure protein [Pseudomonadota bacterium]
MSSFENLDDQADALEKSLTGAAGMAAAFNTELSRIRTTFDATSDGARRLNTSLSSGVSRAIDGVVLDGMRLSDALQTVAQSMINTAYRAAVKPVADHLSGMITAGAGQIFGAMSPFADGAAFSQGRVMPFANGGVVSGPVTFPMRGGTGLMGEAGPEAIMPLARGPDGKLGVRGGGGGSSTVVFNITTPDVDGFRRSQSQIATQMTRVLTRSQRNR